jgi:S1-C subfamily serine protease
MGATTWNQSCTALLLLLIAFAAMPSCEDRNRTTQLSDGDRQIRSMLDSATKGDESGVKRELRKGIDINAADPATGRTALHLAALQGHDEFIERLLVFGADVNRQDSKGDTPLHLAALAAHDDTVRVLIRAGADTSLRNQDGRSAGEVADPDVRGVLGGAPKRAASNATIVVGPVKCLIDAGVAIGVYRDGLAKVPHYPIRFDGFGEGARSQVRSMLETDLRASGYNVQPVSDIAPSYEADYVLAGTIAALAMDQYGPLAGNEFRVEVAVKWEVLGTGAAALYQRMLSGQGKSEQAGVALGDALRLSWRQMLADSQFVAAIRDQASEHADALATLDELQIYPSSAPHSAEPAAGNPVSKVLPSVVHIRTVKGHGSGFAVAPDLVVTNYHVVENVSRISVIEMDGNVLSATVLRANAFADAAVLKVAGGDLPPVAIGKNTAVRPGDDVYAIGSPRMEELHHTVSKGVVSGIRRATGFTLIQTDAAVTFGNSGGPLLNTSGEVIGIVTAGLDGVESGKFAISIQDALDQLKVTLSDKPHAMEGPATSPEQATQPTPSPP